MQNPETSTTTFSTTSPPTSSTSSSSSDDSTDTPARPRSRHAVPMNTLKGPPGQPSGGSGRGVRPEPINRSASSSSLTSSSSPSSRGGPGANAGSSPGPSRGRGRGRGSGGNTSGPQGGTQTSPHSSSSSPSQPQPQTPSSPAASTGEQEGPSAGPKKRITPVSRAPQQGTKPMASVPYGFEMSPVSPPSSSEGDAPPPPPVAPHPSAGGQGQGQWNDERDVVSADSLTKALGRPISVSIRSLDFDSIAMEFDMPSASPSPSAPPTKSPHPSSSQSSQSASSSSKAPPSIAPHPSASPISPRGPPSIAPHPSSSAASPSAVSSPTPSYTVTSAIVSPRTPPRTSPETLALVPESAPTPAPHPSTSSTSSIAPHPSTSSTSSIAPPQVQARRVSPNLPSSASSSPSIGRAPAPTPTPTQVPAQAQVPEPTSEKSPPHSSLSSSPSPPIASEPSSPSPSPSPSPSVGSVAKSWAASTPSDRGGKSERGVPARRQAPPPTSARTPPPSSSSSSSSSSQFPTGSSDSSAGPSTAPRSVSLPVANAPVSPTRSSLPAPGIGPRAPARTPAPQSQQQQQQHNNFSTNSTNGNAPVPVARNAGPAGQPIGQGMHSTQNTTTPTTPTTTPVPSSQTPPPPAVIGPPPPAVIGAPPPPAVFGAPPMARGGGPARGRGGPVRGGMAGGPGPGVGGVRPPGGPPPPQAVPKGFIISGPRAPEASNFYPLAMALSTNNCLILDAMLRGIQSSDFTTRGDVIAKALINIFQVFGSFPTLLHRVILFEIQQTENASTLFRGNSLASKLLSIFTMMIGKDFLKQVLHGPVVHVMSMAKHFEIQDTRLDPDQNLDQNINNLRETCDMFLQAIRNSVHFCPVYIRRICRMLSTEVFCRYPNSIFKVVGGYYMLRFIIPAITSPNQFNIVDDVSEDERRALVLIGKVLMNISNRVEFGAKEFYMLPLNPFVMDHMQALQDIFDDICSLPDEAQLERIEVPELDDQLLEKLLNVVWTNLGRIFEQISPDLEFGGKNIFDEFAQVLSVLDVPEGFEASLLKKITKKKKNH